MLLIILFVQMYRRVVKAIDELFATGGSFRWGKKMKKTFDIIKNAKALNNVCDTMRVVFLEEKPFSEVLLIQFSSFFWKCSEDNVFYEEQYRKYLDCYFMLRSEFENVSEDKTRTMLYGFLQGYFMLVDVKEAELEAEIKKQKATADEKLAYLLQTIFENDGIRHKDLAEKLDMKVSALSQYLTRIQMLHYIDVISFGREKHYHLSEDGKAYLYKRLEDVDSLEKDALESLEAVDLNIPMILGIALFNMLKNYLTGKTESGDAFFSHLHDISSNLTRHDKVVQNVIPKESFELQNSSHKNNRERYVFSNVIP